MIKQALTFLVFLCMCFVAPAHAKLGETVPQLLKRFGTSYTVESVKIGKSYKFRSANFSVDVVVANGHSISETYFSDHPLTASGEPPNDIVRAVLKTNVPGVKWFETEAASYRADYALRSSDNKYIAVLMYRGQQPEDATWTITVAHSENLASSRPATTPPLASTEQPREGTFLFNADLPRNAVEIDPSFVPQWDDFWLQPPAQRPAHIPATCMLVEVYQHRYEAVIGKAGVLENQWVLRFIGWTYMEADHVNWFHNPQNASL